MSRQYHLHEKGSPEWWWLWFRRSLDNMTVRRLNDDQWRAALLANRNNKSITEAIKVARLTVDVETGHTADGWFYSVMPKGQQ